MDFDKLTIKAQEAVAAAQELARRSGNPELYPEHLLLALLDQELLLRAFEEAKKLEDEYVAAQHLLLALDDQLAQVRS